MRYVKPFILFGIGGFLYYAIEILWRGYSHWTMFILGGLCFILVGFINELAFAVVASAFVVVAVSVDIAAIRLICPCMVAADCTAARNYSSADNIVDKSA